jgi:ABC-type glycerol-3-phosphate transport system substrate-binding protein
VDFQLVVGDSLLTAVLAGVGPDVALGNGGDIPVNYAARNALFNLKSFKDFDGIAVRFHPAALIGFKFKDGVYGLPETMSFPMFFYRTDIFERLGLEPPDSWEKMYVILTELQKENMSFGMPQHVSTTMLMMYQRGVELFTPDGHSTNLGTDVGFSAFRDMSDLFRLYHIPVEYDFLNRFRSGEMPAGIVDFTIFNQLVVFAPEIRGRWAFVPIPGTWREDENGEAFLDRKVLLASGCTVMMKNAKNKENSWEFMKWWTSADTQYRFGVEMESLLGPAAKYNTANLEAFERLPWIRQDYDHMMEQLQWADGVRIFPGNYIVDWSVRFAFFDVNDRGRNPNEILLDYLSVIDNELQRKAKEFER